MSKTGLPFFHPPTFPSKNDLMRKRCATTILFSRKIQNQIQTSELKGGQHYVLRQLDGDRGKPVTVRGLLTDLPTYTQKRKPACLVFQRRSYGEIVQRRKTNLNANISWVKLTAMLRKMPTQYILTYYDDYHNLCSVHYNNPCNNPYNN